MKKPTKAYLQELISNARKKFDEFSYCCADIPNVKITYVNTNKRNLTEIIEGMRGLAEMKAHNTKESLKISPNCKNYNKFYKSGERVIKVECFVGRSRKTNSWSKGERVIKVECFVGGHNNLDVTYVAQYDGERRYLFPYFEDKSKAVGYPIIVANFENGKVAEEYRVDGNKILYEKYDYSKQDKVEYYCINFVPDGECPILGEEEGYFHVDPLEYHQVSNTVWCQK